MSNSQFSRIWIGLAVALAASALASCGNIAVKEVAPQEYVITGTGISAHRDDVMRQALRLCVAGFKTLSEKRVAGSVGVQAVWTWQIACNPVV